MRKDYLIRHKEVYDNLVDEFEHKADLSLPSMSNVVDFFTPHITTGKEILDVGCGVGLETKLLQDKGYNVTAIDLSPKMVEHTKKRNPNARVIQGDFVTYPFKRKFDAVFSIAFIHLFPKVDALKVLKKMFSLLKNGGVLFVSTTMSKESKEGWEIKKDSLFPNSNQTRYRKHWTSDELYSTLLDTGFVFKDKRIAYDDPRRKKWIDFVMQKPFL